MTNNLRDDPLVKTAIRAAKLRGDFETADEISELANELTDGDAAKEVVEDQLVPDS